MPESITRKSRIGVYGIAIREGKILLTTKANGLYQGLLDLPGGGIEFGETCEETLRREFKEETAMAFHSLRWSDNITHYGQYKLGQEVINFHHIGLLYTVSCLVDIPDIQPEETFDWHLLSQLNLQQLTPFARHALYLTH